MELFNTHARMCTHATHVHRHTHTHMYRQTEIPGVIITVGHWLKSAQNWRAKQLHIYVIGKLANLRNLARHAYTEYQYKETSANNS